MDNNNTQHSYNEMEEYIDLFLNMHSNIRGHAIAIHKKLKKLFPEKYNDSIKAYGNMTIEEDQFSDSIVLTCYDRHGNEYLKDIPMRYLYCDNWEEEVAQERSQFIAEQEEQSKKHKDEIEKKERAELARLKNKYESL